MALSENFYILSTKDFSKLKIKQLFSLMLDISIAKSIIHIEISLLLIYFNLKIVYYCILTNNLWQ